MDASKKMGAIVKAHMKAAAQAKNEQTLHISLTVGQRVLNHVAIKPATVSQYLAIKNGGGHIVASISNTEDGCYGELAIDGKVHYAMPEKFGRVIEYAILRINERVIGKVYAE